MSDRRAEHHATLGAELILARHEDLGRGGDVGLRRFTLLCAGFAYHGLAAVLTLTDSKESKRLRLGYAWFWIFWLPWCARRFPG